MTRFSRPSIIILTLGIIHSCGQNIKSTPNSNFFKFLNNYQIDSLQNLLADNFEIIRNFTSEKTDRKKFFEYYIPVSKNFNSKFNVLKFEAVGQTEKYLIEDQSDYMTFLGIDKPTWKITLTKNSKNQVESAIFDTTVTFHIYLSQTNIKGEGFTNWLHLKYPKETSDSLYIVPGLLQKRLKEYSNR